MQQPVAISAQHLKLCGRGCEKVKANQGKIWAFGNPPQFLAAAQKLACLFCAVQYIASQASG
jgi:hypothetical protein